MRGLKGSFRAELIDIRLSSGGLIAAFVLLLLFGCGKGGSNQGLVLRALGFFAEPADKETAPTTAANQPDAGRTVSLSQTIAVPNDPDNDSDVDGGFLGLENAQDGSGLTTDGAALVYTIPNSSFRVPNDFFNFSVRLAPSSSTTSQQVFAQIQLVSPATMNFLRSNTSLLPPPPFQMTVTATVTARSDTGTSFVSNPVNYTITFTD
jgi:hypothetical protein